MKNGPHYHICSKEIFIYLLEYFICVPQRGISFLKLKKFSSSEMLFTWSEISVWDRLTPFETSHNNIFEYSTYGYKMVYGEIDRENDQFDFWTFRNTFAHLFPFENSSIDFLLILRIRYRNWYYYLYYSLNNKWVSFAEDCSFILHRWMRKSLFQF